MDNWIAVDMDFYDFKYSDLSKPGVLVKLDDDRVLLIGDINGLGGTCDDCPGVGYEEKVVAYCVVWERENAV